METWVFASSTLAVSNHYNSLGEDTMKLSRYRIGFNTNSSSSHSVIYAPRSILSEDFGYDSYGWDWFTLSSREEKLRYLASQCLHAAPSRLHDTIKSFLGVDGEILDVDHQSRWWADLPASRKGDVDWDFIAFAKRVVEEPGVYILGGNDNDDTTHVHEDSHEPQAEYEKFGFEVSYIHGTRVMKDGDWWHVFQGNSGDRITMSFEADPEPRTRSRFPLTVDIKITDKCPYGCTFCYQGSTNEGLHASLDRISLIAYELSQGGCFEVALGGGEPTLHPEFDAILEIFSRFGIIPNFTTKNWKVLEDHKLPYNQRKGYKVGSYAFSINGLVELKKVIVSLENLPSYYKQPVIHYVMGSTDIGEFKEVIKTFIGSPLNKITLLGYKPTQRGAIFKPHPYGEWLEIINSFDNLNGKTIAIDTALAAQSKEVLEVNVSPILYSSKEGFESMYIDAVSNIAGPCSFCPDELMQTLDSVQDVWDRMEEYEPL